MNYNKLFLDAINFFDNSDYNNAIKLFFQCYKFEQKPILNYYLALCNYKINNFAECLFYAEKFFKFNPEDKTIASLIITLNINLGKLEKVKEIIEEYLEHDDYPDNDILLLYEKLNGKSYVRKNKKYPNLNILFIQQYAGIRCYKYAKALKSKGHKVTLLYGLSKISENYKDLDDDVFVECIKINSIKDIWSFVDNYDIIHCHNEPDFFTVAALTTKRPLIHDTADLISLRDVENPNTMFFEAVANKGATGRVYSTIYQKQKAEELYGLNTPSIVFGNYISKDDLPKNYLPKLSNSDGNIHIVYQGSISLYKHRNFIDIFSGIAKDNIHVHIYPSKFDEQLLVYFNQFPNIHYNAPISPKNLIIEISKYDIGIIPWNLELGQKSFLDTTIANKLYEYLAAGLPVLTSKVKSYEDYFEVNKVGVTFENISEVPEKVKYLLKLKESIDFSKYIISYEDEIYRLEEFYFELINKNLENNTQYKVRDKVLIENQKKLLNKNNLIKINNISIKSNNSLTGNLLIVTPSVEDVGGAAVTYNMLINEFKKRGINVYILTNDVSEKDFVGIKKIVDDIIVIKNYDLNIIPNLETLINFVNSFKDIITKYNIKEVLSFSLIPSIYLEYCKNHLNFKLLHYVTYEPNFDGDNKEIKKELLINNINRHMFIGQVHSQMVFNYLNLNYKEYSVNVIGIPLPDIRECLKKEKNFNVTEELKILVISRLSATKSFVVNLLEDLAKLINNGCKIKLTIIGDGNYLPIIMELIRYFNIQNNVNLMQSMFPLDYDYLQTYDLAVVNGTTSLITSALGIPTIYAAPTTWFNYFGYFAGYAGVLGILGLDYDFFTDSTFVVNQKYTYFDLIRNIYNRTDRMDFLKELSNISKKYINNNINYLNINSIVDKIISLFNEFG